MGAEPISDHIDGQALEAMLDGVYLRGAQLQARARSISAWIRGAFAAR